MQVLDPGDVDVEWDDTLGRRRRKYRWKTKDVPSERITHLRFHPRPGELEGLSPIEAARLTWEGAAYSEEWGSSLFSASGCSLRSVEGSHSSHRREADELSRQWDLARQGPGTRRSCRGGWNTNRSN